MEGTTPEENKIQEQSIDNAIDAIVPVPVVPPVEICGRCNKPKKHENEKDRCHCGRPMIYSVDIVKKAKKYLEECQDVEVRQLTGVSLKGTELFKNKLNVKFPSMGGLAVYLGVTRETIFAWREEYEEFSYIIEELLATQEERLLNNGLAGDYNQTISKVILTKHGYREGIEQTGKDGKDLFAVDPDKKKKSDDAVKKFLGKK